MNDGITNRIQGIRTLGPVGPRVLLKLCYWVPLWAQFKLIIRGPAGPRILARLEALRINYEEGLLRSPSE